MTNKKIKNLVLWFGLLLAICVSFVFAGCSLFGDKSTSEKFDETKNVLKSTSNVTVIDGNNQVMSESSSEALLSMLIMLNWASVNTTANKVIHVSEQKTQQMGYTNNLSYSYLISKIDSNVRVKMFTIMNGNEGYSILDLKYASGKLSSILLQIGHESCKYEFNIKNNTLKKVALTSLEAQDVVNSVSIVKVTPDIEINE